MSDNAPFFTYRPWWTDSHDKINVYLQGLVRSSHLVSNPHDSNEVNAFIELLNSDPKSLSVIDSNAFNTISFPMEEGCCHDNSDRLVKSHMVEYMVSGFAMSADKLWRHHSWCVKADGTIIETTEPRVIYVAANIYER